MTQAEKWAKHAELSAEADRLHARWKEVCQQINDLLMTPTNEK